MMDEVLKLMLLAYGIEHPYRVIRIEEVTTAIPHLAKEIVKEGLDALVDDGFVSRFAGRYCFNRPIPEQLRQNAETLLTRSGTIRIDGLQRVIRGRRV